MALGGPKRYLVIVVDSIVLGQAAGVEHVSFYSRTVHLISSYNEP